jgi:putative redox protein
MTTTTVWKGGLLFESTQPDAGKVLMDGHVKEGISPKALLLAGLAGCSSVDVVEILQKMRVEFKGLVVTAEAEQTDELPRVFKDIVLTFQVETKTENEEKVKKAIDLSMEKYCGVAAMLRKNSAITSILKITGDQQ